MEYARENVQTSIVLNYLTNYFTRFSELQYTDPRDHLDALIDSLHVEGEHLFQENCFRKLGNSYNFMFLIFAFVRQIQEKTN